MFFLGGVRDVDPKSLLQKKTRRRKRRRIIIVIMGRSPVRLKEVVYGVSSNKVEIMGSLARDALSATAKKIGGGWFDVTVFGIAPLVGTVMCVVLCVVVVVSLCVFFRVLVVLFFFMRARSPRSRVASSRCLFCHSLLSFRRDVYRRDGKQESKTVPECAIASLSLTSWLESQESDRKHLSLSFFLSNRYAANYKEQEKLDHRF